MSDTRGYRLEAIDVVRGLVVVVMALDHARDFFMLAGVQDPMKAAHIPPALFATRWITHLCAPTFTWLSGVSAGLMLGRRTPSELTRLLLTRGLWLWVVEVLLISTALTFAPGGLPQLGGRTFVVLQTLFAIGAGLILLAALHRLGRGACLGLGALLVLGHDALGGLWPSSGSFPDGDPAWLGLHTQVRLLAPGLQIFVAYPLLPWLGVSLLGFGASGLFERLPSERDRLLRWVGLAACAAFVVLRALDVSGDPHPFRPHEPGLADAAMAFLNTSKYPPSLLFVLMTLGPAALLLSIADGLPAHVRTVLASFGRAPFAFYVTHFYLLHLGAVALGLFQGFEARQLFTAFPFFPQGYGLSLAGVYGVWAVVVAALSPFCRWVAAVKSRRRDWWLSYL